MPEPEQKQPLPYGVEDWEQAVKNRLWYESKKPEDLRAAWDFLYRLQIYLEDLISQGVLTQDMAANMWEQHHTALFPEPTWKVAKQTAEEKLYGIEPAGEWITPKATDIQQLPLYATVRGYLEKQATARIGEIEDLAQKYADAQSLNIKIGGVLPLNIGGTRSDQLWGAEQAKQDLLTQRKQIELAMQDNPFLQSSLEAIDKQMGLITQGQNELRTTEQAVARGRTSAAEQTFPTPWQLPQITPPKTKPYSAAVKGIESPNARRYFESRMGNVYSQFEREQPGARARWWEALHPPPQQGETPGLTGQYYGTMPSEAQVEAGGITGEYGYGNIAPRQEPTKAIDPWEQYLNKFPFAQTFLELPRSQRGFYPSASVASARWFT